MQSEVHKEAVVLVDADRREVRCGEFKVSLAGKTFRFRLLATLIRRPGVLFTPSIIEGHVWDGDSKSDSTRRSLLHHLRRDLQAGGLVELAQSLESVRRDMRSTWAGEVQFVSNADATVRQRG